MLPNVYRSSIDGSNDPFLQHVSLQLHDRFGDDYAGAWQTLPNVRTRDIMLSLAERFARVSNAATVHRFG